MDIFYGALNVASIIRIISNDTKNKKQRFPRKFL